MEENKEMNVTQDVKKEKKKVNKKLVIIIVLVSILLIVGGIAAIGMMKSMSESMEEAMSAMGGEGDALYEVELQDVKQEITTSGTVIGLEKHAYTSPVTAKVDEIPVVRL